MRIESQGPVAERGEESRGPVEETGASGERDAAPTSPVTPAVTEAPDPESVPWSGPAQWVIPALLVVIGATGLWGAFGIEAPPNATRPGPGAFPGAIGALLLVVAVCMTVVNLRGARTGRTVGNTLAWFESRPVVIILAGMVVHVALLETVGWLLTGALLFWTVAYAFGARAYLRDAVVALSMSAAVQIAFSLGLGLRLPGGLLESML